VDGFTFEQSLYMGETNKYIAASILLKNFANRLGLIETYYKYKVLFSYLALNHDFKDFNWCNYTPSSSILICLF